MKAIGFGSFFEKICLKHVKKSLFFTFKMMASKKKILDSLAHLGIRCAVRQTYRHEIVTE